MVMQTDTKYKQNQAEFADEVQDVRFTCETEMSHQDAGEEDKRHSQRYTENLNLTQQHTHRNNECIQADDMGD